MKRTFLIFTAILLAASSPVKSGEGPVVSYSEINLSHPEKTNRLCVPISTESSIARGWTAGQEITIEAAVARPDGTAVALADTEGCSSWTLKLDAAAKGVWSVTPARNTYTGSVTVKANGQVISPSPLGDTRVLEKVLEYTFDDGTAVKVKYTDRDMEKAGGDAHLAREALDAAVAAYQTITEFHGFTTPGFTFADPDRSYAFDPDKTIEVLIGDSVATDPAGFHGFAPAAFHDAPCFDTRHSSGNGYDAVILLPAGYRQFIKSWEKINPSPLGTRNVEVDLRGTLMHEMLHVVLFYYNKNLNSHVDGDPQAQAVRQKKIDWYVEGLARYFETFAGARHDFFSQGFKQTLPDRIRFSRGGSNYFMRYPDQAFTELRYENALFWRYIDYRYGMNGIEALSREFRGPDDADFGAALERATNTPMREILARFALAILYQDFGLKDDSQFLLEIARTHLKLAPEGFRLVDGFGAEKPLGRVCATDWIGKWENERAALGGPAAAGDTTEKSDVSGWATDFVRISIDPTLQKLPKIGVRHASGGLPLSVKAVLDTVSGSQLTVAVEDLPAGQIRDLDLDAVAKQNGLGIRDFKEVHLLITNTDPKTASEYQLISR